MAEKKRNPRNLYRQWMTPEGLEKIKQWALDGLVNEDIAHNMGVSSYTFYEWKKKFPEMDEALSAAKEVADERVVNALYQNAIGFKYKEEVVTNKGDVVEVERFSKPNVSAQIFWLKNRRQDEWRDNKNLDVSGSLENEVIFVGFEDEDDKEVKEHGED